MMKYTGISRIVFTAMLVCLVTVLAGCSGNVVDSKAFLREGVDIRLIERLAVLPFSGSERAGRVRELATTELLASGMFDVVDMGRVDIILKREAVAGPLDVFTIRRLGESLNVQAVLIGSVEQTKTSRGSSSFPELTLTLRLIDCESGQLIWQASGRGSGYSVADRLFGFAPKDIFEVTFELLESLYATMY